MMNVERRGFLALGIGTLVSACSFPRGSARVSEILDSARKDPLEGYAIYTVNHEFLRTIANWPMTGDVPQYGWPGAKGHHAASVISEGDHLDIRIWDSDPNSLLAGAGEKSVTIPESIVDNDGMIFMPYIDRIHVAGLTSEQARADMQKRLLAITPSAQVQLVVRPGPLNSADLAGGVARPGSYPLADPNLSVIGLITLGGGVNASLANPIVRLIRNDKVFVTTVSELFAHPERDLRIRGGDRVVVETDPREFVSFGAVGKQQVVQFPKEKVSALDAMATIGGLKGNIADAKGILVLREYSPQAVRKDGSGPSGTRVIFLIDITSADGLFSAKNFQINPGDVVYVSESPLNSINTIATLLNSALLIGTRSQNLNLLTP